VTGPWPSQGDRVSFLQSPLVQDLSSPATILAGTYRVWKTIDGGTNWSTISGDLTSGSVLFALTVAPSSSTTIYSGSGDGRLFVTTDGTNWFSRDAALPDGRVTDIIVDPADPLAAYVSFDLSGGPRVFKTPDAGLSWTDVTGDLPNNLRGLSLAVDFTIDPPLLYLGTDYGVYSSTDGGATWAKETAGLPNCAVYDLGIQPGDGAVVAATHGRGMWLGGRTSLSVEPKVTPAARLLPISPNPTRAPIELVYQIVAPSRVALEIFDLFGRRIRALESGMRDAGRHTVTWDGRDASGAEARDGVYFSRLSAGGRVESRRLVILR